MFLDNAKIYKKLDRNKVGQSIENLASQVKQVLAEAKLIKVPKSYTKINQVVVNGMGGSNIGAGIVSAVFSDQIKVPITLAPGYCLPASVNRETLFLISSYSGTTEEPLSVYGEVKRRKAKVMAITCDEKNSKLAKLMIKDNIPGYIFNARYNPSKNPRLGWGYLISGTAVLLARAGLFKLYTPEIKELIAGLKLRDRKLKPAVNTRNNVAKQLALKIYNKEPVVIAAEFLIGNLRAMRNQLCESGKNFASYLTLPELNHYTMEGLANPKSNPRNLCFFFFDSALYHPRIQKRSRLTKLVARKNRISVVEYKLKSKTKFSQAFEMLQLSSWISYYLAILNQVDPSKIPWVDWFKKKLA